MASPVPAKSQPLHNFSLPHWEWKRNHTTNHHRGRRLPDSSPHQSPPPDSAPPRRSPFFDSAPLHSPIRDSPSESDSAYPVSLKNGFLIGNRKNSSPSNHMVEKLNKKSTVSDVDLAGGKEIRSKIYIRLPKNKPDDVPVEGEVEESVPKTWNLRPRRPLRKSSNNGNGGILKVGGLSMPENEAQWLHGTQNRPELEVGTLEKKETIKEKFSVALSREEIEEDIFVMTGSKPPRRPKKRSKTVQKQLDNFFPGLWLASITPDLYKVPEGPIKG